MGVSGNRRLYFHGFTFFACAPVAGFLILSPFGNPRAMLSLHLACWLAGAVTCAAAAAWPLLAYAERGQKWTERCLILGMWSGFAISAVTAFAGVTTMFAGGGHAPAWADDVIKVLQLVITATLLPALASMVIGLGKRLA